MCGCACVGVGVGVGVCTCTYKSVCPSFCQPASWSVSVSISMCTNTHTHTHTHTHTLTQHGRVLTEWCQCSEVGPIGHSPGLLLRRPHGQDLEHEGGHLAARPQGPQRGHLHTAVEPDWSGLQQPFGQPHARNVSHYSLFLLYPFHNSPSLPPSPSPSLSLSLSLPPSPFLPPTVPRLTPQYGCGRWRKVFACTLYTSIRTQSIP